MAIKRSRKAYAVPVDGRVRVVTAGTLMDESDPRYREQAGRFESVDNYVGRTTPAPRPVEAATAEPGERRDVAPAPEKPAEPNSDATPAKEASTPPTRRGPGRPRKNPPKGDAS